MSEPSETHFTSDEIRIMQDNIRTEVLRDSGPYGSFFHEFIHRCDAINDHACGGAGDAMASLLSRIRDEDLLGGDYVSLAKETMPTCDEFTAFLMTRSIADPVLKAFCLPDDHCCFGLAHGGGAVSSPSRAGDCKRPQRPLAGPCRPHEVMYEQNGDGAVDDHFNFQAHSGPESGGVYTARRCLPEASKMEEEDSTSS